MIKPKSLIENVIRIQEKEASRFFKVRLDRNERTHPFSDEFIRCVKDRISGELLMVYPDLDAIYEKFANLLGLQTLNIIFNNGSDLSIKAIFETYISEGDKLLMHRPGYAMFPIYANMFGASVIYQDFDIDLAFDYEEYIDKIDSSFRMAVLENPNGFIGVAPPAEVLLNFIKKCETTGTIALIDEAYYYFHNVTAADHLASFENLIVIRTFSKAFGLAGMRSGYTLSCQENIQNIFRVKPMYEFNSAAIIAIDTLLDMSEEFYSYVRETKDDLQYLKDGLADLNIVVSNSVANFVAARFGEFFSGEILTERLYEKGVLLRRPFREEHLRSWTRVGTAPKEKIDIVLDTTREILKEHGADV